MARHEHYTEDQTQTIIEMHDAGQGYPEIAAAVGHPVDGVVSYARRIRKEGKWPDNAAALRELPSGKPGRPRNRDRPRSVGARLSEDVVAAMVAVAEKNNIGRNEFIVEAIWFLAEREELAQPEECYDLRRPSGAKTLDACPRTRQISTQIPQSDFTLAGVLAEARGEKVGTVVAAAVHALLTGLGYTLWGANV